MITLACVGSILNAGAMSSGVCELASSALSWYLKAICVCLMFDRFTAYSPSLSGVWLIKAGLGATFSRLEKFSRRIVSTPGAVLGSAGL